MSSPNSPDWAANRRVLFCVGDHADEACEAWSWATKYFLEPDDDITLLRVWEPKSCSSDEDTEATESTAEPAWLPPLVRDGLRRREAALPGSHKCVLLPEASSTPSRPAGSPRSRRRASTPAEQILRYASRIRATVIVLAARPRHGTLDRAMLGSTSDAVVTRAEVPCLVVVSRRDEDVDGVSSPFETSEGSYSPSRPPPTYARGDRERSPSPSIGPAGRRIAVAVEGSAASAAVVRFCARTLLRPRDEVVLIHAMSHRACDDETYRRTYADERSPPLGASAKEMREDAERAWSELENLLTRAQPRPLFPNLGPGKTTTGKTDPERLFKTKVIVPNPGVIFAGVRNEAFVHRHRDEARWDDLDALVAETAAAQRSFRCGYPPRGAVVSGPARLAVCDAAARFEADLLVVGSKGTTGWRRAVYPSVSTHCMENASCPVLVFPQQDASPRSPTY